MNIQKIWEVVFANGKVINAQNFKNALILLIFYERNQLTKRIAYTKYEHNQSIFDHSQRGLDFTALYNYLVCKNYCLTRILNQGHFWDPLDLPYWWVAQFSRNPFKIFMSLLCYSVMITFDLETWESDLVSYFYWYLIFESQKS